MSGAAYLFDEMDLLLALLLVCHTQEGYIADPHSIQHVLQPSPGSRVPGLLVLLVLCLLSGAGCSVAPPHGCTANNARGYFASHNQTDGDPS